MKETWKDIADMKGYMISSCGNIKSVDRTTQYPDGHIQKFKGRQLKTPLVGGYHSVTNKRRTYKVHRLVAKAFMPNPHNKPKINHINGDKCDNRVTNLEIVTSSYNQKHAYATGLQKPQKNGARTISAIKNGHIVAIYSSINDMCRDMNLNRVSVWQVLNGKFSQHHGYTFSFTNH